MQIGTTMVLHHQRDPELARRTRDRFQEGALEATERVLARYSKSTPAKGTGTAKAPKISMEAPTRRRGRRRTSTTKPVIGKRTSPSLGEQILALATGKTQQEIIAACKGARPNHIGVAIARHKRAGRVEERDGKLYSTRAAALI